MFCRREGLGPIKGKGSGLSRGRARAYQGEGLGSIKGKGSGLSRGRARAYQGEGLGPIKGLYRTFCNYTIDM